MIRPKNYSFYNKNAFFVFVLYLKHLTNDFFINFFLRFIHFHIEHECTLNRFWNIFFVLHIYNIFWYFLTKVSHFIVFILFYILYFGSDEPGSVLSASDVKSVRRPGWTPKFSQFIHDKRAVKSETKINLHKLCDFIEVQLVW